jgi:hypothetical protein
MLISYLLYGDTHYSHTAIDEAAFIEKLKSIGATNIAVYTFAHCSCKLGLVVVDEDGTEEPCNACYLGMRYKETYFTPATTTDSKAVAYEPDEIPF